MGLQLGWGGLRYGGRWVGPEFQFLFFVFPDFSPVSAVGGREEAAP